MIREVLSEAVRLNPTTQSVVNLLSDADPVLGPKANVLFLRMLTKRISDSEQEEMANEIRNIIGRIPDPKQVARLRYSFDAAFHELKDEVAAPNRIGSMISNTLKSGNQAEEPETFTIKSIAKAG
jgi:hypothetical protein